MASLAETLTNVDVEQDVVAEQFVKTLLAHMSVLADQDLKVSLLYPKRGKCSWHISY